MDLSPCKRSKHNISSREIIVITFATLALVSTKIEIPNGLGLEQSYIFVTNWGSTGTGDGQFRHQHGIDVDSSSILYVTVRDNMEVQKFTKNDTFIGKWGVNGTGNGEFYGLKVYLLI